MPEQQTCGKGLAENATLPASLGELVAATARVLEVHMKALDLTDENGKRELDAYRELASMHRRLATELASLAERMASYRDLPMARHDMAAMTSPAPRHAFAGFVRQEERLLELLQSRLAGHRAMLAQMEA
jgi:phytoene dehydrogenase-like protein